MSRSVPLTLATMLGLGATANGLFMLISPANWYFAVPGVTTTGPVGHRELRGGAAPQTRIMEKASDAPNLASALNVSAFNLGNAIGAALGGGVIDAGFGYAMIPVAGGVMAGAGLAMLLLLRGRQRSAVVPTTAC